MKKLIGGSVALVIVAAAAFATAGATSRNAHKTAANGTPTTEAAPTTASTSTSSSTSTSTSSSTTSTTKPKPVDPMKGAVMLGLEGRKIMILDAQGNLIRTIVTAFADRYVLDAKLLGDHRTIFYLTEPTFPTLPVPTTTNRCQDVVRLDLLTNKRTVIAHADQFSVNGSGSRVALRDVVPDSACYSDSAQPIGNNVVLDIATGRESKIVGDSDKLILSPGGHVLVSTHCATQDYDCGPALESASVPDTLGAPVTFHDIDHGKLSFEDLDARADGLYAIVDSHSQECTCTGPPPERTDRDRSVRRFSWSNLGGSGTTLFVDQGPFFVSHLVVTPAGVYAGGAADFNTDGALYRLHRDGSHPKVRESSDGNMGVEFRSLPDFVG